MGVLFLCRGVYTWGYKWYIETNLNNEAEFQK